jgi:ribosomal protein L1
MSEPEFFPSHAPHHVEMPEGSNVAKSKSAHVGSDIRRVAKDETIADEDLEVAPENTIRLQSASAAASNIVKLPQQEKKALKTVAINLAEATAKAANASGASPQDSELEAEFETEEMVEMDFPARVIQLKIENDAIREELKALDALMKGG